MAGVGGKHGWAWIFILEGLVTVVVGSLSFGIMQDFPDGAKFLTEVERTVVIRRLQRDDQYSAGGEKLKMKYIGQSLSDWKTYLTSKQDLSLFNLFNQNFSISVYIRRMLLSSARVLIVPPHHYQPGIG
jgi:hypothetical protein